MKLRGVKDYGARSLRFVKLRGYRFKRFRHDICLQLGRGLAPRCGKVGNDRINWSVVNENGNTLRERMIFTLGGNLMVTCAASARRIAPRCVHTMYQFWSGSLFMG